MGKSGIVLLLSLIAVAMVAFFLLRRRDSQESASVTRAQMLAMAERYVQHVWKAGPQHVFHGIDPDGIRVDTPDLDYVDESQDRGWWSTATTNVGIPYKWGGFDLPEEFDQGLSRGLYAGDCYSAEKRRLLDDAVSKHCVGIDCSGFISRCWGLDRSYSTRELPGLCDPISDFALLKPGDIFNRHNAHVRLFAGWADEKNLVAITFEAGPKVRRAEYSLATLTAEGYSAWRLKSLRD